MNVKMIVVSILFGLIMCGCSSDEPRYSCDKEVDEWVKEHVDEIQKMTRAEWLESDAVYSIPMYRAFTPEQKVNFWREKFQELKTLPWSEGEINLIEDAESFVESHLNLFGPELPSQSQLDEAEIFFYKWSENAKKDFGWSDDMIRSMLVTGDRLVDTKGKVSKRGKAAGSVLLSSSETCNCNQNSWFTCSHQQACDRAECSESLSGCGFLMMYECNGMCEEPK